MADLLEFLFELVHAPYNISKRTTENSRIGTSPNEEETPRFWKWFGIVSSLVISAIGLWIYQQDKILRRRSYHQKN
ncbi:MAG: hypothetical protein AAF571_00555 [Verrucomicrobiota bacterium]